MSFQHMSNEQIKKILIKRIDEMRIRNGLQQKDMHKQGGIAVPTYDSFINKGSDIRLSSFLGVLRALDKLDAFEKLFDDADVQSLISDEKPLPKRVTKRETKKVDWDEDA
jgi:hypothetical protein